LDAPLGGSAVSALDGHMTKKNYTKHLGRQLTIVTSL